MPPLIRTLSHSLAIRRRLWIALAFGLLLPWALPDGWGAAPRAILGWDACATTYLVLVWAMMLRAGEAGLRRRAQLEDESRIVILMLCITASVVSLGALPSLLGGNSKLSDLAKTLHLLLGVYTIIGSWAFLQTIFTVHYAHEYYAAADASVEKKTGGKERGGLDFAGDEPFYTYVDFAYFAFTIGMTAQTSDTAVTTARMRRLALVHSVVTFFFNTGIMALTINMVASLLSSNG